ncbi:MAG TPA: hypothetical protein ENH02_07685 [Bacteroidetes bacterium]|nr:hypothetical protein [Bacteroidota bacterium]
MKNTFSLEVMNTERVLTENEQHAFRMQLKHVMKTDGIISLCLDDENLYVEIEPDIFNLDAFKLILTNIGFPVARDIKLASFHYAV